jgi:hypothetical protein
MRWFNYIFSISLIWLICSADGCDDGATMAERSEERQIASMKDSIREVFEVISPDDRLLRAYEATAKQKLIDFSDYIKIASDTSVNIVFRTQAAEMAGKLFKSGSTVVEKWNNGNAGHGVETVDSLLGKSIAIRINSYIQPVQITVQNPLKMKNDSVYQGNLAFYPQRNFFVKNDSPLASNELLIIDVYAVKKVKHFGKESLSVWEVFLGDLKNGQ